jgi:soluble lytic murein transglycosylase-like protein
MGFVFWIAYPIPSLAAADQAHTLCDAAAQQAAQNSGVPLSVLMSIARVETGTSISGALTPWPWAANLAGKGYFFQTKDEAIDFSAKQIDAGNINFDVGCFQINLRWHSKGFTSLENAFDPVTNAHYAAKFLTTLYQDTGNWSDAVATYHSRTPEHAQTYLEKVKSVWNDLQVSGAETTAAVEEPLPARVNTFPLLQSGAGTGGSLVPQINASGVKFALR